MVVMVCASLAARVAAGVLGFVRQRWRLLAVLLAVSLLTLPLLRGDVAAFGLNGIGLGVGAMVARRILFWWMPDDAAVTALGPPARPILGSGSPPSVGGGPESFPVILTQATTLGAGLGAAARDCGPFVRERLS